MEWKKEWKLMAIIIAVFLALFYIPIESFRVQNALIEAVALAKWYAREHVILCLIPAFFIAGAIAVFISQSAVIKYLGARASKIVSYGVASVSGSILAVCSCTVLPLFAGIYRMGAGLGPATAFLYSGPAINVLAIILTARVLGLELGIARAVGAIIFSIIIGLLMHLFFLKEESERESEAAELPDAEVNRPLWKNILYFGAMIGILVFASWGRPEEKSEFLLWIYANKWIITTIFAVLLGVLMTLWFNIKLIYLLIVALFTAVIAVIFPHEPLLTFSAAVIGFSLVIGRRKDEPGDWFDQTWAFAKQILPLLFAGVLVAGFLLGRPGEGGLIPSNWISQSVGGNSLGANLFASVAGAFMYFATLTEVPILQGLLGSGMGKGPALALLLAGPALSLPNMLVIRSVIGTKKTVVFVILVVCMATISGMIFGSIM